MKIRSDFVTNSSSSSFIIAKKYLDSDQLDAIRNHYLMCHYLGIIDKDDRWMHPWNIEENDDFIAGYVNMDNLPIDKLLDAIGIPSSSISWSELPFNIDFPDISSYEESECEDTADDWRTILHNHQKDFMLRKLESFASDEASKTEWNNKEGDQYED